MSELVSKSEEKWESIEAMRARSRRWLLRQPQGIMLDRVWRAVADHQREHGFSPSWREIQSYAGCSMGSVALYVYQLHAIEFIRVTPGVARSIQLLKFPPGFVHEEKGDWEGDAGT